jgi:hypothetical protein
MYDAWAALHQTAGRRFDNAGLKSTTVGLCDNNACTIACHVHELRLNKKANTEMIIVINNKSTERVEGP